MSLLPKGYMCVCGKEHEFSAYVYAHWNDKLVHTCDGCGSKNALECGDFTHIIEDEDNESIPRID